MDMLDKKSPSTFLFNLIFFNFVSVYTFFIQNALILTITHAQTSKNKIHVEVYVCLKFYFQFASETM